MCILQNQCNLRLLKYKESSMNNKFDYWKCNKMHEKAQLRSDFRKKYLFGWGSNPRKWLVLCNALFRSILHKTNSLYVKYWCLKIFGSNSKSPICKVSTPRGCISWGLATCMCFKKVCGWNLIKPDVFIVILSRSTPFNL